MTFPERVGLYHQGDTEPVTFELQSEGSLVFLKQLFGILSDLMASWLQYDADY